VRTITEANTYSDLYLLDVSSGAIERLTNNREIGESSLSFSPDSKWMAFSAPNNFEYFRNGRVYLRAVADRGGTWKKLGDDFDGDVSIGFWSDDGKTIYFNEGWRATNQFFSLSVETGKVSQLTNFMAVLSVQQDDDTKRLLINYSDPTTPQNLFTVPSVAQVANKASWTQLTDSNPQVANIQLGETEVIQWKSTDGRMVEGVLIKPVNYEKGKRYPLVVQIHGGPAAASTVGFNASYGYYSHVYAGAGYFALLPNYRGSTNYGERFKMETAGDYFRLGYDDIMTGVDHLIRIGLVDGDKMGVMGWSAGGHYANWILTHTNRFKAISSGAGAMNWISMYAQSDIQRNREFYFKGKPYDRFDHYWDVSPLKYIKNAKTPTLIHVVDGDPRVPRPQSEELHMALKKLGVPTEFFVYPGNTHGITEMRNQLVKMVSEFHWMEKWIKGKEEWFTWEDLLKTLKDEKEEPKKEVADK
jgi:dipeptidyl aminopeptidase/acylaminoacyl peptidase